ncbi:MAG: flagellar hook-length control protein FliK [Lachnobacterium sp.]|nr:flagellar hook-length control protein FliK [Lachnobacterium sp.]
MQISDLVGQYNQASASGAETLTGTKGVENLVSSLRSLTKGNIFEGTVSSMKNGRVTLALSSGQQISARIEGKVQLSLGQSMFFQVKSNDGSQIAIRPFSVEGTGANYTLLQALSAAGVPTESNYLSMVNRMMEEQMPIDRNSIQQMARMVNAHPEIDVQTLVQLNKLGITINEQNAAQFENYLDDKQAITNDFDQLIEELPQVLESESLSPQQMRNFGSEFLLALTDGLEDVPLQNNGLVSQEMLAESVAQNTIEKNITDGNSLEKSAILENGELLQTTEDGETVTQETAIEQSVQQSESYSATPHTLGALLDGKQLQNLNTMLGELLGTDATRYTKDSGVAEVLKDIQQVLKDSLPIEREQIGKLFSSKEFVHMVKDTMQQQWTLQPQDLEADGTDKVAKLYDRMNAQLEKIVEALKSVGQENTGFAQTAADIQSNVEFMNQINQAYTYVQIPLQMSGQNASAELFVYTNKKALAEGDRELTAFLHLDLDHLGATDVSVKMKNKQVSTNFYLDDDASYQLISLNIDRLEKRLQEKGYQCKVSVINEAKHVNFVENFLKKDQPSAGQLHRYSFDMRA